MANSSANNTTIDPHNHEFVMSKFITKQTIWTIHTMLSIYLFVVLVLFEKRRRSVAESTPYRSRKARKRSRNSSGSSSVQKNVWLNIFGENPMCILTMTAVLLRCALLQLEFNLGSRFELLCNIFTVMYTVLGLVGNFGIYMLLWARQWGLYNSKPLKPLLTKRTKAASLAVLIGMLVEMAGLGILFIMGYNVSISTPSGCVYHDSPAEKFIISVTLGVMVAGSMFFQLSLLALTIYPLSKQYDTFWCCCHKKMETGCPTHSLKRVRYVIRRISISCAVCIFSDIIFGAATGIHTSVENYRTAYLLMFYNVSVTVNVVAVIGSFNDWKDRLLPTSLRSSATSAQSVTGYTSDQVTTDRPTAETPIRTQSKRTTTRVSMPAKQILELSERQISLQEHSCVAV